MILNSFRVRLQRGLLIYLHPYGLLQFITDFAATLVSILIVLKFCSAGVLIARSRGCSYFGKIWKVHNFGYLKNVQKSFEVLFVPCNSCSHVYNKLMEQGRHKDSK